MILTQFVPSKWLHIGLVLFFFDVFINLVFIDLDSVSVQGHVKNEISSHVHRTSLVNNPYII